MTNSGSYRAVIFDMDGVLADSEPLYFEAINAILRSHGSEISEEQHTSVMASGPREAVTAILSLAGIERSLTVDAFLDEFEDEIIAALAQMEEPLPGAREVIDALRAQGIPIGLASSSKVSWIAATLRAIGLEGQFDAIVSGTQVSHPKPAPDVYLKAAAELGVPPEHCIAIEDTPTGLRAVKAAGMLAIQVRSSSTPFPPQPEADVILYSLEDFDPSLLTTD